VFGFLLSTFVKVVRLILTKRGVTYSSLLTGGTT
jgi:hypothetical protein